MSALKIAATDFRFVSGAIEFHVIFDYQAKTVTVVTPSKTSTGPHDCKAVTRQKAEYILRRSLLPTP